MNIILNMQNLRNILNELKWRKKFDLGKAEIWYVHRGVPNNTKIITGNEILSIGRSFIETTTAMIPYHRIFKIKYNGELIFKR
jgi:uncharacterized protein (UPF0248 family)